MKCRTNIKKRGATSQWLPVANFKQPKKEIDCLFRPRPHCRRGFWCNALSGQWLDVSYSLEHALYFVTLFI